MEPPRSPVSTPEFWQGLYADGNDGWELGGPAPPLESWLERHAFAAHAPETAARVAVPGAGRGHDARLLARRGYRVWGFDWAPSAVAEASALAAADGVDVTFETRDIFTLADSYAGFFDGVWEYTCFCAIDPARREEYVRLVHALLRPGGRLLACFFPMREGGGGPPFPVSRGEIDRLLSVGFRVVSASAPARSAERRASLEWLVTAERD